MRGLIVNSDDFGYSAEVNAAVLRAHREGILTSASLMVAEAGYEQAVEVARRTPTLGVGLHVVAVYDRALLPPREIPHLVGPDGKFGADPFRVGLRYAFSGAARAELRRELEAQFERFAATGLPWSHVDGHLHFHMHPVVWDTVLDLCDRYGVHRLRLPYEELRGHFRAGGDGFSLNTVASLFLRLQRRRSLRLIRARKTLGGRPIFTCDRVYGQLQTGNMTAAYTRALLPRLTGATNEIYYHPGAPHARLLPPDQQRDGVRDVELHALLDPEVRAELDRLEIRRGCYEEIEVAVQAGTFAKSATARTPPPAAPG